MPKYTTADIRNIALTGGAGTGKTTLVEHILHNAGVIGRAGKVEEGNTVCDYDELSKEFKHSFDSTIVHFDYENAHINLVDTPGSGDFLGKTISVFPAVETVAVVIDAAAGIETVTRRVMKIAAERDLPRLIIVNKIDHATDLLDLVGAIQETFGSICKPVNLPKDGGKGVIDCFSNATGSSVGRSHLFMKVKIGTPRWRQTSKSLRVCASMPFPASITITTESTAVSTR